MNILYRCKLVKKLIHVTMLLMITQSLSDNEIIDDANDDDNYDDNDFDKYDEVGEDEDGTSDDEDNKAP